MKFPTLEEQKASRDLIDSFRGYNHNLRISDNEFYDMKNLTSTHYPILSPRSKRGVYVSPTAVERVFNSIEGAWFESCIEKSGVYIVKSVYYAGHETGDQTLIVFEDGTEKGITVDTNYIETEPFAVGDVVQVDVNGDNQIFSIVHTKTSNPQGLLAKDALCYVDGRYFCMNEYRIDMGLEDSPKQLVSMGAYVIIMPDKKYINTLDLTDFGNIEASYSTAEGVSTTYEMCKVDGTIYQQKVDGVYLPIEKSQSAPGNPTDLQLWIDTSSTPHVLKQYSKTSEIWVQIATTYIKISAPGIASAFKQYDAVKITGFPTESSQLKELEGNTFPLWEAYHDEGEKDGRAEGTNDYIVIVGILDEAVTYETDLRIERNMPAMDFIIESQNRLWGCRYGPAKNGEVVNEIYSSKLGDFKNWNCFMGISTDSYVASVGSDGVFTGAITYLGYPLFFKENYMHKVYGNYPANYQVQTNACRGVQDGSDKSLAIVNEVLYYKARNAVCAYDGSLPTEISSALGDVSYFDAVAGSHGNKYYISMKDFEDHWSLFVYDTAKGMWHREDDLHAKAFCSCRNDLYYLSDGDTNIRTILGSGTQDEAPVEWMAETGTLGIYTPDKKYVSRLSVRMSLALGTRVYFYAQYDSSGEWEHLFTMTGTSLRSFAVPIRPKRCDHMKIRIVGKGDAKIYSISKTIEQGSDI